MTSDSLETIEVQTGLEPKFSVIWMHGLGADGHDFESIVPQLRLPENIAVRFIFPHAPMRAITLNGGMVMRGWYDLTGMELVRHEDEAGMKSSAALVRDLMEQENARGITDQNIILAGFSQGGAIALYAGLRHSRRLAGIMALSTYLPLVDATQTEVSENNRDTPIFMGHGQFDPVIPLLLAQASRDKLEELNYQVEWHTYPMQHSVAAEEINHISRWLTGIITQ